MASGAAPDGAPPEYRPSAAERYLMPGCLFTVAGFFGGGMMAVAIAKVVGQLQGCAPAEGLPACNHHTYMVVGALLGMVLLPSVSLWRIRRGARQAAAPGDERSL